MRHLQTLILAVSWFAGAGLASAAYSAPPVSAPGFTLKQVLDYPFPQDLTASKNGNRIAWVINLDGVRNVWVAQAPRFAPRQVTHFTRDDGLEISQLTFAPGGNALVFVHGGDPDASWPMALPPDPTGSPVEPKGRVLWTVDLQAGTAHALTAGHAPAISSDGTLAYIKNHQVWSAPLNAPGKGKPTRLFFDRGKDGALRWSPDGKRLAFVSDRGEHAFIGVFTNDATPLLYLAPSTDLDGMPRWSPDGSRIAFIRQAGEGGPPQPFLKSTPQRWSIMVASARSGKARVVWHSPDTSRGSYPQTRGEANLHWARGGKRLVFLADLDGWPHVYSIDANGGTPLLLTPGNFMVQDVALARNGRSVIYNANTGSGSHDQGRRHVFQVPVDRARPVALTAGTDLQWSPTIADNGHIAYIDAGPRRPPLVKVMDTDGSEPHVLQPTLLPDDFPTAQLVIPQPVTFQAADGTTIHGQLFRSRHAGTQQPGVIAVHGGPSRQMLLGWHPMGYYSNAYAVNQYLATHGFTVLSVNYRLGTGYGHAFHHPPHAGLAGAAEYQDVVAGATFLQHISGVDTSRIGIWGGSYGGFLTALALARNSDIFKAGVDMSGINNWTTDKSDRYRRPPAGYEQGDYKQALKVAWASSPDASIATWKSPVLLIQGDDDHEVRFRQLEDLVPRLRAHDVPFETMVLPNEIHGFLRHASWTDADQAAVKFLTRKLGAKRH